MRSLPDIAATAMRRRSADPDAVVLEPPPFDPVAYRLEQAGIALASVTPVRFGNAEVSHPVVAAWLDRFATSPAASPSLLLTGSAGTGKSHHAFAALRMVALDAARSGRRVIYRVVTHPDFNQRMRPKADGSHEYALDPYLTADLLVFDDLGAGKQTDWTADSLYRLVDHRWSNALATIYTTNLGPDDLTSAVGPRVVSRVFDSMRATLTGSDRRRPGGAR